MKSSFHFMQKALGHEESHRCSKLPTDTPRIGVRRHAVDQICVPPGLPRLYVGASLIKIGNSVCLDLQPSKTNTARLKYPFFQEIYSIHLQAFTYGGIRSISD